MTPKQRYRERNRDLINARERARQARLRAEDPEAIRARDAEYQRRYRAKHPEKVRAMSRAWYAAHPEWRSWSEAKQRVTNQNNAAWPEYGGRGITMAQEWFGSFDAFLAHIGPRPSSDHSLDRIDVNGNYEPGNVRWATKAEQAQNRRPRRWGKRPS